MDKRPLTQTDLDAHLFQACATDNRDYAAFAIAAGANVNAKETNGWTPLHRAADMGALKVVATLIENGADINASDSQQNTPLHIATNQSKKAVVRMLVANGAAEVKNYRGWTPLKIAKRDRKHAIAVILLGNTTDQKLHTARVTGERKDKGPPQVGG